MNYLDESETDAFLRSALLDRPVGPGFSFCDATAGTFYDWHTHPYHQLIYAVAGTAQIESDTARHILAPGRAAWIPAGLRHRTLVSRLEMATIYLAPGRRAGEPERIRIVAAPPLMREMILHANRWPHGAVRFDRVASSFFETFSLLCGDWLEGELALSVPRAGHLGISRAMDDALADSASATLQRAIELSAMSERTFRRTFARETGMAWREWLIRVRMIDAMGLLAGGVRVTDAAFSVGYESLSAFAKAFRQITGESPAEFARRAVLPMSVN